MINAARVAYRLENEAGLERASATMSGPVVVNHPDANDQVFVEHRENGPVTDGLRATWLIVYASALKELGYAVELAVEDGWPFAVIVWERKAA